MTLNLLVICTFEFGYGKLILSKLGSLALK